MSKTTFDNQMMQGVYTIGRQRDQLSLENRQLRTQLRHERHYAKLGGQFLRYQLFAISMFSAALLIQVVLGDGGKKILLTFPASCLLILWACKLSTIGNELCRRRQHFRNWFARLTHYKLASY